MRGDADGLGAQILEEERHAPQRPLGQAGRDGGAGVALGEHRDGVQRPIDLLAAGEGGVQELCGRDLPARDQGGEAGGVVVPVAVHGGGLGLRPPQARTSRS